MYGCSEFFVCVCVFYQLVIIFVLSDAIVLPRSCFLCMHFLAMYYESDVKLYCAWSSFLELAQAHYK